MRDRSLATVKYTAAGGGAVPARERVIRESALSIIVNQRHFATVMHMPTMEEELVIGHLFGQGVIDAVSDIELITIKGDTAEVLLAEAEGRPAEPPVIQSGFDVTREDIFRGVRAILKSEIFTETEAVHSAGLFGPGAEAICIAEDLGRHNALDKVIGCGLQHGIDFSRTFATSTGRLPAEMILKCRRAGIPIIASKGVPTTLAIDIARRSGITVAGLVRGDTMIVYTNPVRIA
jgi:FdhD protein